jgi:alpha-L-fucosidase
MAGWLNGSYDALAWFSSWHKWGDHTNSEVADTALRSDEFMLGSGEAVVTSKKFVRFVGSAVHIDAPATARKPKVEKRIVDRDTNVSKQQTCAMS